MFYDNFVRLCNRINKTPTAVVIEIGKSRGTANKWKAGTIPHDSTLRKLADYFGVSTEYLLENAEKPTTPEGDGLTDFDRSILAFLHDLPPERLRGILIALDAPSELLSALDREVQKE